MVEKGTAAVDLARANPSGLTIVAANESRCEDLQAVFDERGSAA